MRQAITASAILLLAGGAALAGDLPDGVGVLTPSSSVFTTEIAPASDTDDYVFQGFPGMTVTASVKIAKGSLLVPDVQILRPGGVVLSEEDGVALTLTSKSATAKVALDATGWWKVRVRGTGGTQGAYSVSVKYTAPVLATLPVLPKNSKRNASISVVGDSDEFRFPGYTGQTVKATLALPKSSLLNPVVALVRPDGSVAVTAGQATLERSLVVNATFDADGTWVVRVVGESKDPPTTDVPNPPATTGAYSLALAFGKPPVVGLSPDANGQYRIALPGVGGATIGYSLKFTVATGGAAPTFNSLVDPTGRTVIGFPATPIPNGFGLTANLPLGDYSLTFDAPAGPAPTRVTCARTLKLRKGAPKRIAKLSAVEPVITYTTQNPNSINPPAGGANTIVQFQSTNAIDPFAPTGDVTFYLGHTPMTGVSLVGGDQRTVQGTVPGGLPYGVYDVVMYSTSGQPDAVVGSFTIVPPPQVTDIDPSVGPSGGNFPVVITGSNFRAGKMGILIDGFLTAVSPTAVTETTVTFLAPPRAPGFVSYGVQDRGTQLTASLAHDSFEYTATAAISRIVPSLIPTLGNELITIQGANFSPTDKVYLENDPAIGGYEWINRPLVDGGQVTYVSVNKHSFMAPPRSKHAYNVYVVDQFDQPQPPKFRKLTYYSFADFTTATNLGSIGADKYDGWTTALGDYDNDGDQDLFISRRGDPDAATAEATSLTRVLRNDGNGSFADRTTTAMPDAGVDDWRADRIWCTDINQDGFVDLVLNTNAIDVPTSDLSHLRMLMNEQKGGTANPQERVFRDRTIDLMAFPRTMKRYGIFGGDSSEYISDNWRGLDMWVGDLDKGAAGPPEIVITHDEVKDDDNPHQDVFSSGVYCGNYCSSSGAQQSFAYSYTFYWGGSRMFVWDKTANSGTGRYKFDPTFFPRKSGPVVPQGGVPGGGGQIAACSPHYASICKGVFTPFTGKRIAVSTLDGDTKPDIAVLSDQTIQKRAIVNGTLLTTSSLQVGINKTSAGIGITDVTDLIFELGGDFKGDAIAIGQPGYPDGNSYGVIAITKESAPGGGNVMRLTKYKPPVTLGGIGSFEDVTAALPPSDSNEKYQGSRIAWLDVDKDGDQDMVILAPAALGGTDPALRILRNERQGTTVGVLRRTLEPLFDNIVTPTERFDGSFLSIGDVTGDGLLDYIITRAVPSGPGAQTRIVKTDQ